MRNAESSGAIIPIGEFAFLSVTARQSGSTSAGPLSWLYRKMQIWRTLWTILAYGLDVVVIGSGFGGSTTALRLTEKGYRVGVLEAGRRFADHEFAKTSWRPGRLPLGAEHRLLRDSAHPPAAQRSDPRRGRCRLRIAELREHPLHPAGAVLHRPAVGAHHRLALRTDAALRAGPADVGGREESDLHRRRPHHEGPRR